MRRKNFIFPFFVFIMFFSFASDYANNSNLGSYQKVEIFNNYVDNIYRKLSDPTIHFPALKLAIKGYFSLKSNGKIDNENIIIINFKFLIINYFFSGLPVWWLQPDRRSPVTDFCL